MRQISRKKGRELEEAMIPQFMRETTEGYITRIGGRRKRTEEEEELYNLFYESRD